MKYTATWIKNEDVRKYLEETMFKGLCICTPISSFSGKVEYVNFIGWTKCPIHGRYADKDFSERAMNHFIDSIFRIQAKEYCNGYIDD